MATTLQSNTVTLQGSAAIVAEFFEFSVNSILYQRGVYPPENFCRVQKYGLTMLVTDDERLKEYLQGVANQLKELLRKKMIRQLVLVIADVETKETLERWEFKVHVDEEMTEESAPKTKELKTIQQEIAAIIRQIVASVTFLPQLEGQLAFDLLVYTKRDGEVNEELWADSKPMLIEGGQMVKIKSFSTSVHTVDAAVVYR
ncbi:mitotic spindle assembly checkpoint protein MAD2A [Galendromus occidentalis]|uniref:Mitotic spindle assembly checkpoint protein MAD2A n=1 Tax=Galendromus occidentalis TaxID=34638 RepID=A0AAJ6QPE8_9ACAR|nr:mitotic spindle assembly checkpoint protein MAD2A [Galendromus occidentalis]